jgi:serine/threonine protein kinase
MGEVYRADDLRLGQQVALKLLPGICRRTRRGWAQFHNEVRTARQVSHQNVGRVYDIGEAPKACCTAADIAGGVDGTRPAASGATGRRSICFSQPFSPPDRPFLIIG